MSWHCLPALVEAFSAGTCSDGEPCAPLKSTPSVGRCYSDGNWIAAYRTSLSGMMSAHSTAGLGADSLTLSAAGSPAKTSRRQARERALTASEAACGVKWRVSSARYDRDSHSWKIAHALFDEDLPASSETWPRWGMMRAGELFRLPTPSGLMAHRALITSESGCLSLPHPTTR